MRRSLSPKGGVDAGGYSPMALHATQQRNSHAFSRNEQNVGSDPKDDRRPHRRGGFLIWNLEKVVLLLLFLGALFAGYIGSAWLWQIKFEGWPPPDHARDEFGFAPEIFPVRLTCRTYHLAWYRDLHVIMCPCRLHRQCQRLICAPLTG
jgi:hypothetical protein